MSLTHKWKSKVTTHNGMYLYECANCDETNIMKVDGEVSNPTLICEFQLQRAVREAMQRVTVGYKQLPLRFTAGQILAICHECNSTVNVYIVPGFAKRSRCWECWEKTKEDRLKIDLEIDLDKKEDE